MRITEQNRKIFISVLNEKKQKINCIFTIFYKKGKTVSRDWTTTGKMDSLELWNYGLTLFCFNYMTVLQTRYSVRNSLF